MQDYWTRVRQRAVELGGDGCSGVPDFYKDCCDEHDIHYRTHCDIDGNPITRAEADSRIRQCIQAKSFAGVLSPMALWRWLGLRLLGGRAWNNNVH